MKDNEYFLMKGGKHEITIIIEDTVITEFYSKILKKLGCGRGKYIGIIIYILTTMHLHMHCKNSENISLTDIFSETCKQFSDELDDVTYFKMERGVRHIIENVASYVRTNKKGMMLYNEIFVCEPECLSVRVFINGLYRYGRLLLLYPKLNKYINEILDA